MWFKVDDKFPSHKKALRARRSHPSKRRDVSPLGLWVLAGAWSDDGFVPLEVLEDWDDDAPDLAARLVDAGLWTAAVRDGEDGFLFHDWTDMNPVELLSTKGIEGNHLRWHVNRGIVTATCPLCNPGVAPESGGDSGGDSAGYRPESESESPDPSRPDHKNTSPADAGDGQFEQWWDTYPRKVGKGQARKAYTRALAKTDVGTLLDAARRHAQATRGSDPKFVPHPATWLNGERWTDEPGRTDTCPRTPSGVRIDEDWSA